MGAIEVGMAVVGVMVGEFDGLEVVGALDGAIDGLDVVGVSVGAIEVGVAVGKLDGFAVVDIEVLGASDGVDVVGVSVGTVNDGLVGAVLGAGVVATTNVGVFVLGREIGGHVPARSQVPDGSVRVGWLSGIRQ